MPVILNAQITDFWDANAWTNTSHSLTGLSEITNENYLSDSTIPSNNPTSDHYYYYPNIATASHQICEDYLPGSTTLSRKYIKRSDKAGCDHFAFVSMLNPMLTDNNYLNANISNLHLGLDNNVHETYAKELLPRAAGYSAALLDYFFRGQLSIQRIPGGLKVKNTYTEEMASYVDSSGSTFGTISVFYDDADNIRQLLKSYILTASLAPGADVAISFTEPSNNIQKGRYIVVFRGKLGNEEGAVIGKVTTIPIYYVKRVNGRDKIYMINGVGGEDTVVYENVASESLGKMSVSPDNSTLAFTGNSIIRLLDLFELPATTVSTLTTGEWPDWSPDGEKIVFHRIVGQNYAGGDAMDIFTIDITTLSETRLTTYTGLSSSAQPAWSPDGNTIAYTKYSPTGCSTQQVVSLMDTSGNFIGQLACPSDYMTTAGAQAAWSPDGQEIAFVRIKNYCIMTPDNPTCKDPLTRRLYKVHVSNQSTLKLTDTPDTDIYDELDPAWSPDGATITISSEKAGIRDIWSVDARGRGYQANLTNSDGSEGTYPTYGK
jgi:Tol biopolymer transport system component